MNVRFGITEATGILRTGSVRKAIGVMGHSRRAYRGRNDRKNNRSNNRTNDNGITCFLTATHDGGAVFQIQITDRNLVQF